MSKSLGNSLVVPAVLERVRGDRPALLHGRGALPLARGVQLRGARGGGGRVRAHREVPRARRRGRSAPVERGTFCADFEEAMDDDLGTPAASPRSTTWCARATSCSPAGDSPALRGAASSVRAMLAVLGLDPLDPHWAGRRLVGDRGQADGGGRRAGRRPARAARGGPRRQGLRGRRRDPRPAQGGRHRARGHPAGPHVVPVTPGSRHLRPGGSRGAGLPTTEGI